MTADRPVTVPGLPTGRPETPDRPVTTLGLADTARVVGAVVALTLAAGVVKRRPWLMRVTEWLGLDRRAIATMTRLRDRHGGAPVLLRVPGRRFVFPMSEVDAGRVLAGTPDPFTPATTEKRAALRHFQPHAVLVSTGTARAERRAFNEAVLQPELELHALAPAIADVVRAEAGGFRGEVGWDGFDRRWWRIVRRIVLGDSARDDEQLTDLLDTLREAGNWAYLRPRRRRDRARLHDRLADRVRATEPGSLAARVAAIPADDEIDPAGQLPHWLFAFDAAGMATFRTLALLARHPDHLREARADNTPTHSYLRACVLDTVRLWPTTPALLRQSTQDTDWGPAGTTAFLYTPFFHRDRATLPWADRFTPEAWLDGTAAAHPALTPFSAGPGQCPGRGLVLHTTSTTIAALLADQDVALLGKHAIDPPAPLPATLDNFSIRLNFTRR